MSGNCTTTGDCLLVRAIYDSQWSLEQLQKQRQIPQSCDVIMIYYYMPYSALLNSLDVLFPNRNTLVKWNVSN